jgi:hypothetical protein
MSSSREAMLFHSLLLADVGAHPTVECVPARAFGASQWRHMLCGERLLIDAQYLREPSHCARRSVNPNAYRK